MVSNRLSTFAPLRLGYLPLRAQGAPRLLLHRLHGDIRRRMAVRLRRGEAHRREAEPEGQVGFLLAASFRRLYIEGRSFTTVGPCGARSTLA